VRQIAVTFISPVFQAKLPVSKCRLNNKQIHLRLQTYIEIRIFHSMATKKAAAKATACTIHP
jgi:hypothetical protein